MKQKDFAGELWDDKSVKMEEIDFERQHKIFNKLKHSIQIYYSILNINSMWEIVTIRTWS